MRLCDIEGCGAKHRAHGLCKKHEARVIRHKDRPPKVYLPFEPLVEFAYLGEINVSHMARQVGVGRTIVHRCMKRNRIELFQADCWAIAFHAHPIEIWSDTWLAAISD